MNALVLAGSEPAREDGGVGHSGINPREWRWSSGDGGEKGFRDLSGDGVGRGNGESPPQRLED